MREQLSPPAERPTVVVVDDDPAVRNALKFALEIEGFAVEAHANADAALAARMPGTGCLVIDYALPGMNGLDLLAQWRSAGVALPAILITTHPGERLRQRAATAEAVIVEKPLLGNLLSEAILKALGRAAS